MSIFKSHLDDLAAYQPPLEGRDPERFALLDFNERTQPVAENIVAALHDYIDRGRLQMYPSYGDVVARLAKYAGVSSDQLMVTNGSDHGIELIFRSVCCAGDEVILPGPTFAMYHQCARVENLQIIEPQYTKQGGYPVDEVLSSVSEKTRLIVVSNPNNPCGTAVPVEQIVRIAKAAPNAAILVDECYFEYSKLTAAPHLDECPNILVTRTFSKTWGLPSLRFGYILSCSENINTLLSVRGPYDVNQLAIVAVEAALSKPELTLSYVDEVMSECKPMLESFLEERSIPFWQSAANYLWVFPSDPESVEEGLREQGILVRPKKSADGQLGLRITVGNRRQTERLIEVLGTLLS